MLSQDIMDLLSVCIIQSNDDGMMFLCFEKHHLSHSEHIIALQIVNQFHSDFTIIQQDILQVHLDDSILLQDHEHLQFDHISQIMWNDQL